MFSHYKAAFFTVLGFTAGGSLIFYTFTTSMQKYLVNTAGMSIKTASNISTGCLFLYMCMQPAFGALATVLSPLVAFELITLALAIVSFYTSIGGSAEYVALALKSVGHERVFFWYLTVMMVVAFLVALRLPREAKYLAHHP